MGRVQVACNSLYYGTVYCTPACSCSTGCPRIVNTTSRGHTITSGSALYNVCVSDRRQLVGIRALCGAMSLADCLTAARLRWFGHAMRIRMDEGRMLHVALHSTVHGVTKVAQKPATCEVTDMRVERSAPARN